MFDVANDVKEAHERGRLYYVYVDFVGVPLGIMSSFIVRYSTVLYCIALLINGWVPRYLTRNATTRIEWIHIFPFNRFPVVSLTRLDLT